MRETMMARTCKCGRLLATDGEKRAAECNPCLTARRRKWRYRNPAAAHRYMVQNHGWRKKNIARYNKAERARYDQAKRAAQGAARRAINRGELVRPDVCSCGCGSRGKMEAHHDDYSKPLVVRWLSKRCHEAHHVAERAKARTFDESALTR